MHNSETKQQKYLRESAEREQIETDKNGADKILQTLLSAMPINDLQPVREIIKHPHEMAPLIQPRACGVVCFFVLHAALLMLAQHNINDILNEMTPEDISELRKLISIAQRYPRPNANNVANNIKDRISKDKIGTIYKSQSEQIQNQVMIKSLKIYAYVTQSDTNWNGAVNELKKWANTIDNRDNTNQHDTKKQPDIFVQTSTETVLDVHALETELQTFINSSKLVYKQLDGAIQKRDSIQSMISNNIDNYKFEDLFTQLSAQHHAIHTCWETLSQISLARGVLNNLQFAVARKTSAEKSLRDADQALQFASIRAKTFLESLKKQRTK